MKRQLKCTHNKAVYPEMGVICDLRQPNSLCRNCRTFKSKHPNYFCKMWEKLVIFVKHIIFILS
jgi:hypothetical protein